MSEWMNCDCGKPGELRSILFFSSVYCNDCYNKAMEELERDVPFDEENIAHQNPVGSVSQWQEWNDIDGSESIAHEKDLEGES